MSDARLAAVRRRRTPACWSRRLTPRIAWIRQRPSEAVDSTLTDWGGAEVGSRLTASNGLLSAAEFGTLRFDGPVQGITRRHATPAGSGRWSRAPEAMNALRRVLGLAAVAAMAGAVVLAFVVSRPSSPAGTGAGPSSTPITPAETASALPSPTVSPSATPTETPRAEPTAAVPSTPPPCCTASPLPSDDEALARSDRFWNEWVEFPRPFPMFEATSLADASRQADVIVIGRISNLYVGEYWRIDENTKPIPLAYVSVEIDEVLKGEPISRESGFVEVQMGAAGNNLDEIRATLPGHAHLWFLMYGPDWSGRELEPQRSSEMAPFEYFATNDQQGVLRDIDDVTRVVRPEWIAEAYGSDYFPLPLEGTSFDLMVEQVRALSSVSVEVSPAIP